MSGWVVVVAGCYGLAGILAKLLWLVAMLACGSLVDDTAWLCH